jgi:hypothetical protein
MSQSPQQPPTDFHGNAPEDLLDRIERALESYAVRVVLSLLIVVSVLPPETHTAQALGDETVRNWFFFAVFGIEFGLRVAIHVRNRASRSGIGEPLLLVLDLVAVLSFLPWEAITSDLALVRLIRLSRIILLLGYWRSMVSDLWSIIISRERRFQVAFVMFTGFVLAFASSVVLHRLKYNDPDGDGNREFYDTLWWAFRQVQDPGNLVAQPDTWPIVVASLLLTFAGLFLFAFVVGIGTTAIEELMHRSRTRPVGLRQHTVILGLGEHSHFLLEEFAQIYRKNRRALRSAILGPSESAPITADELLDLFHYRSGDPVRAEDLDRVDVQRAKRVLILGTDPHDPDAAVIAAILALRDRNPVVDLYPDLEHESSLLAARTAGGAGTHVVGSGSFVGNYIAQNVANPGIYRLYRQLLTSAGCEIYTFVFYGDDARRMRANAGPGAALDWRELQQRARREHGVTLLGYFVAPPDSGDVGVEDLDVLLAPRSNGGPDYARTTGGRVRADAVRGLVGVALRWDDVLALGESLLSRPVQAAPTEHSVEEFESLRLVPTGRGVKRITIVGGSRRIPRVVADLIALYGPIEVGILVRDRARIEFIRRDLEAALERTLPERSIASEWHGSEVVCTVGLVRGDATIRIDHAEWSDATRILQDPALAPERTDVLLFLPRTRGADALDGQVALDCLQLADLSARGETPFPEHARVLAMVQDPVKGDLLEKRLDAMTGADLAERFTVISSERVRHHFIVQNVFVRGLNSVYASLFAPEGPSLRRLEQRDDWGERPHGDVAPAALARYLDEVHGQVLFGLELDAGPDREPRTVLDPSELASDAPLPWTSIRALYALATRE